MHGNKPSLPSIQHLLGQDEKKTSSLPSELQRLSLYGPQDGQAKPSVINNPALLSVTPSWMAGSSSSPSGASLSPSGGRHQRSVSEFPVAPSFAERSSSSTTTTTTTPPRLYPSSAMPSVSYSSTTNVAPPSNPTMRAVHHHHRRAVSANTADFMLRDTMDDNLKAYAPNTASQQPPPPRQPSPTPPMHQPSPSSSTGTSNGLSTNGRYVCPYCQKRFSRPSSLRIHVYSHTGEKPFVCPEEGCGRRFSVQSNMRRHLRVHRLSRSAQPSPLKLDTIASQSP